MFVVPSAVQMVVPKVPSVVSIVAVQSPHHYSLISLPAGVKSANDNVCGAKGGAKCGVNSPSAVAMVALNHYSLISLPAALLGAPVSCDQWVPPPFKHRTNNEGLLA